MITIYGASDDLIEVEGCDGADEFNVYGTYKAPSPVMWSADLIAPGGDSMQVHAILTDRGCWAIAVGQSDEDIPLPSWPVTVRQHRSIPYSTVVEIAAPDGTRLDNVWPERDEDET